MQETILRKPTSDSGGFSRLGASLEMPIYTVSDDYDQDAEHDTPDGGPYCPACRGARWLKPVGFDPRKPMATDYLIRCPDCQDGQRAARANRLASFAGLSDEQRRKRFDNLASVRGMGGAVKAAAAWTGSPDGWLVIHGLPGSGKTHLSLAVANALIAREQRVIWRYVPRVIYDLQQQIATKEPDAITPLLVDAPILILDDLAAVRWTEYVAAAMELVFDSRYQRRLPTLVTLIGDMKRGNDANYSVTEDVKAHLSFSIGRRMEDPAVCRIVRNAAGQYGRAAQGKGRG